VLATPCWAKPQVCCAFIPVAHRATSRKRGSCFFPRTGFLIGKMFFSRSIHARAGVEVDGGTSLATILAVPLGLHQVLAQRPGASDHVRLRKRFFCCFQRFHTGDSTEGSTRACRRRGGKGIPTASTINDADAGSCLVKAPGSERFAASEEGLCCLLPTGKNRQPSRS